MVDQAVRRYPLSWPVGWKRTPGADRRRADFGKSVTEPYTAYEYKDGQRIGVPKTRTRKAALSASDAALRLELELERLGATDAKLSTSQRLRVDGTPRSDLSEPSDVGAAVYFTLNKKARCLACDRWLRVADNIAAIAQHIDALRRIERYGIGTIDQAFRGYDALPADTAADWRSVFGFGASERVTCDELKARYRDRAKSAHPDAGGNHEMMAQINRAHSYALQELDA